MNMPNPGDEIALFAMAAHRRLLERCGPETVLAEVSEADLVAALIGAFNDSGFVLMEVPADTRLWAAGENDRLTEEMRRRMEP